jgi:hypothetical protein
MDKPIQEPPKQAAGSRFSSFLIRVGGVFLAPDATFSQALAGKTSFWEPFAIVFFMIIAEGAIMGSFCYRIMSALASSLGAAFGTMPMSFLAFVPLMMIAAMLLNFLITWIVVTGIAHLMAKYVFRGKGSFVQLMKLYGYSFAPFSLVILGTVLFGMSWATWPVCIFLNVVATFWIVVLMSVAVKQNYGIDTGKAFISSFIGPMLVWFVIVGIFWLWIWLAISSLAGGAI